MRPTVTMTGSGSYYPYADLFNCTKSLLKTAKKHEPGSGYCRMASVLFSAFAIEATLNHIGKEKLSFWDIIERRLSWQDKICLLSKEYNITIDYGKRPFQTLKHLFKFRDFLAHGKTTEIQNIIYKDDPNNSVNWMDPECLKQYQSNESVDRVIEDTENIIELFLSNAGFDPKSINIIGNYMSYEVDMDSELKK